MCLNRLNATVLLCDRIENGNALIGVFDHVEPIYGSDGRPRISFSMLINLVAVFPKSGIVESNSVQKNTVYEVLVRLNYVKNGTGIIIDNFDFSTEHTKSMCRDIVEMKRIIDINDLILPNGTGEYGIKIFIKKKGEDTDIWSLQTVHGFQVG